MTIPETFISKGITFHFVLREDKTDKFGKAPIYLRVTRNRKISLSYTGHKIKSSEWNKDRQRVNRSHPNSVRFNNLLEEMLQKAEEVMLDSLSENKDLTAKQIKEGFTPQKTKTVQEVLIEKIEFFFHVNRIGSAKRYKVVLNKINRFTKDQPLLFSEITYSWLESFEYFLFKKLNNQINTVHSSTKTIRAIMNEAVRRGDIDVAKNPFIQFKLKKEATNVEYLSDREIEEFENLQLDPTTLYHLHQQLFLFAVYGGGMRISDLLTLKHSQVKDGRIYLIMRKTNKQISFKLPEKALGILENMAVPGAKNEQYLLPFLHGNEKLNEKDLYNRISSVTALINKNLKIIAAKLEWQRKLHFHMSRHTFATRALSKGMRIEYVSAILGHSTIQETQRYAKVKSRELDLAMELI